MCQIVTTEVRRKHFTKTPNVQWLPRASNTAHTCALQFSLEQLGHILQNFVWSIRTLQTVISAGCSESTIVGRAAQVRVGRCSKSASILSVRKGLAACLRESSARCQSSDTASTSRPSLRCTKVAEPAIGNVLLKHQYVHSTSKLSKGPSPDQHAK